MEFGGEFNLVEFNTDGDEIIVVFSPQINHNVISLVTTNANTISVIHEHNDSIDINHTDETDPIAIKAVDYAQI